MAIDDGAAVKLGWRSSLGFGEQTAYVDPAAAVTRFFEFNSEGLQRQESRIESAAIRASEFQGNWGHGARSIEGDVVFELAGVQQSLLWKHALGGVDTALAGGAAAAWEHVFTPDSAAMQDLHLTAQVMRDDVRFRYVGLMIGQLQLSCDVDQTAQLTASLVGRDELVGGAPDEPSFPSPYPLLTFVHGNLRFANADVAVNSVSWSLDNGLAVDRRRLGSALRRKPQRTAFRNLTGSFNADFADLDLYNAFVTAQPGEEALLELDFVSNLEIEAGHPYAVRIRQSVRPDGTTPTVGSSEEIRQELQWKAFPSDDVPTGVEVTAVTDSDTA